MERLYVDASGDLGLEPGVGDADARVVASLEMVIVRTWVRAARLRCSRSPRIKYARMGDYVAPIEQLVHAAMGSERLGGLEPRHVPVVA